MLGGVILAVMDISLLQTKLHTPNLGSNLLLRRRLIDRLNTSLPRKLTLIAAPAGYGKTTLATDWLQGHNAAWLSLDQDDNDPVRFLRYVIATFQQYDPTLASNAASLLQVQLELPPRQVINALINDLSVWSETLYLVLDDYHLIENEVIHNLMTFLLEHLPLSLHVVITSRMELPFSIARWRVQQQVLEIRAADLRFTPAEMAALFNDLLELDLTGADISALAARTEGWVASLQLAALSMRQQNEASRSQFVQRFAGSNRYLMDYLVDEILDRQPLVRKRFLLWTSVLQRFNAELCAALSQKEVQHTREILRELEQAHLFLIPLDDQGHWFRYHHLFADYLAARVLTPNVKILGDSARMD